MSLRYALINPPLTDPTSPYHSISYLVGAAEAAGFQNGSVLDANILALEFASSEREVAELLREAEEIRCSVDGARQVTRLDQLQYRSALAGVGLTPERVTSAVNTLKDPSRFYDGRAYAGSMLALTRWLDLLNLRGLPVQFTEFGGNLRGSISFTRSSDLTNARLLDQIARPFAGYFDTGFRKFITGGDFDLIGLSVNYIFQLPYAIWMSRAIARAAPRAVLCIGGTEIADIVKYSSVRLLFRLFAECQAAVLGDGETAFVELLRSVERRQPLRPGSGIVVRDSLVDAHSPRYEDLGKLPAPRYDIWDWDRYWSPEPVVLYSPTRGCYWNRCTFCDYGLNTDSPTSPARERPIELALADLTAALRIGRTFYFAVDAIPPAYLRKLCAAIVDKGLRISWAAEMRMEGGFTKGLGSDLVRSGCVAVSFGYESGNQRILQLIDKAQKVDQIPSILHAAHESGIACQMMGFIGFPTETVDEALQTYGVLHDTRDNWMLAGIGDFVLTPGAIVAKDPHRFGISSLGCFEGDDIHRWLWWVGRDGLLHHPGDQRDAPEIREAASQVAPFFGDRPFVGGIDSAHSILYFRRFGPRGFNAHAPCDESESEWYTSAVPVADFASVDDLSAFHRALQRQGKSAGWSEISEWLNEPLALPSNADEREIEIAPNGAVASVQPYGERRTFTIVPAD